jgi:hypothetical protein
MVRRLLYFFSSIGWPQHVAVPLPPRVTIASAPHFVHMYLFPAMFAMFHASLLDCRLTIVDWEEPCFH